MTAVLPKILLVEDDEATAGAFQAYVERSFDGLASIQWEESGSAALRPMLDDEIALCIVDVELRPGGMSGWELIARALDARPEMATRIIVCSGDPFVGAVGLPRGVRRLDKPFNLRELDAIIREAIGDG